MAASLEPIERVVESGLGGVFYLLNLGLYLGLYADFTRPAEGSVGLNPWTFVAQLARVMTGEQDRDDPIWPMLDALADRRSRPIRARAPMPDWRVPPEWLRPFRGWRGEWQWSRAAGRLRIDHPAGFRVIDVLDNERLGPRSALRGYPVRPRLIRVRPRDMVAIRGRAPFARWIELIAAYARPRLGLALGLELGGDQLARLLLRQQAQIHLTESAVDVVFSLASLPLEVRRAGLDRDIGWLPAAGRYIRFHFE